MTLSSQIIFRFYQPKPLPESLTLLRIRQPFILVLRIPKHNFVRIVIRAGQLLTLCRTHTHTHTSRTVQNDNYGLYTLMMGTLVAVGFPSAPAPDAEHYGSRKL